jgi:hypothetical protein
MSLAAEDGIVGMVPLAAIAIECIPTALEDIQRRG